MSAAPRTSRELAETVLEVMRTRRVVRRFTDEPVSEADVRAVLEAGRWATTGGNRHVHRFLVVRDPAVIRLVKLMSPGMLNAPTALIVVCLDLEQSEQQQVPVERHDSVWIDVGTAAMNMMVVAHALGLGSCPVTSYSRSGVSTLLDLPETVVPQLFVLLGHPARHRRQLRTGASTRLSVDDLTYWEHYGQRTTA
ncbi:MAG TPA: nitroreductase family protein [Thermomicrobiaceae bacterium]|nr:nitroreductase family protein [Thermomicrobiaceae bacterium]